MPDIRGGFGSFPDAVRHFRDKVNLPTRTWRDLWRGEHTRAFVVAGATNADLLADFRTAVDAAISQGETLDDFRARFDEIVARHGWQYNGSRNWRSNVIYQTNLRTSYMAGRWDTLKAFPYLRYQHNTLANPREEHRGWDGLVLERDDPWWLVHYPPNGWGCRCTVTGVGKGRLRALGKDGPDATPGPGPGDPPPEWSYHVGVADSGRAVADPILHKQLDATWTPMPGRPHHAFGRPDRVPADVARAAPYEGVLRPDEIGARWDSLFGASSVLRDPSGAEVLLSRKVIEHWLEKPKRLDGRQRYLPLLRETIEEPFEIWINWAVNGLGRVGLRRYYLKTITGADGRALTLIAQVLPGGVWGSFDFYRGSRPQPSTRQGLLVWGRPHDGGGE